MIDGHPCDDVQGFFEHLSLSGITDAAVREKLQNIPTGLTIPDADVDQLVAAGEQQVRESKVFAEFRDSLTKPPGELEPKGHGGRPSCTPPSCWRVQRARYTRRQRHEGGSGRPVMTRANGANYLFVASLSAALAAATAAPSALSRAQAQQDDRSACEDVKKHYLVEREQLNARTLTDLLFEATQKDCAALVEQFLAEGASVKARTGIGNTALIVAARMGHTDIVELLLARGAEIDQRNLNGVTALLAAATNGRMPAVKTLLTAGADAAIADKNGVTPLIAAAFSNT